MSAFRSKTSLVVENLLLRQQLAILRRTKPRPRLRPIDRALWVTASRLWSRWADSLAIVQPATVIAWHRRGFARWWAWKSRPTGRPPLAPELVSLIERTARENPLWAAAESRANWQSSVIRSIRTPWPRICRGQLGGRVVLRPRPGRLSFTIILQDRLRSIF